MVEESGKVTLNRVIKNMVDFITFFYERTVYSALPSYLNQKKDIFLIKIPFQNTYLRLYANIKSENIGADEKIWRRNPLTREIVDSVHPL